MWDSFPSVQLWRCNTFVQWATSNPKNCSWMQRIDSMACLGASVLHRFASSSCKMMFFSDFPIYYCKTDAITRPQSGSKAHWLRTDCASGLLLPPGSSSNSQPSHEFLLLFLSILGRCYQHLSTSVSWQNRKLPTEHQGKCAAVNFLDLFGPFCLRQSWRCCGIPLMGNLFL